MPLRIGWRAAQGNLILILTPDLFETLTAALGASHGQQLVGAWSRLGLYHPGPLWFYWAAPFVAVLDGQPASLFLAALALVSACAVATVLVVTRTLARPYGAIAAIVLLAALHQLSLEGLAAPWNPTVLIMPTTLGLVCVAASCGRGSIGASVVGVVAGAFVAQAHLGAVPLGGLIVVGSVAGAIRSWSRMSSRGRLWAWGLLLAATAMPWTPVVADQLWGVGNAGVVAGYAVTGEVDERFPPEPPSESLRLSVPQVTSRVASLTALVESDVAQWGGADILRGRDHRPAPASAAVLALLVVVTTWGAAMLHRRQPDRSTLFVAWLCRVGLLGLLIQLAAATRARNEFRDYLVAGASGVGVALWLGAVLVTVTVMRRFVCARDAVPMRWAGPATSALAVVMILVLAAQPALSGYRGWESRVVVDAPAIDALLAAHSGGFTLRVDDVEDLRAHSRLVVALDRKGRRVHVFGRYAARFSDFNRRAEPGAMIHLTASRVPGCRPIGLYDDRVLCLKQR